MYLVPYRYHCVLYLMQSNSYLLHAHKPYRHARALNSVDTLVPRSPCLVEALAYVLDTLVSSYFRFSYRETRTFSTPMKLDRYGRAWHSIEKPSCLPLRFTLSIPLAYVFMVDMSLHSRLSGLWRPCSFLICKICTPEQETE